MSNYSDELPDARAEPSGPESAVHLWLILWKAYDAMREYAAGNIESLGIGLTDFGILEVLLHKGPTR